MEKTFLTGFGAYDTKIKTGETYQNLELKDVARLTRTPSAKPKEQSQWAIFSTYRDFDARSHDRQREAGDYVALAGDIDTGNHAKAEIIKAILEVCGDVYFLVYSTSGSTAENRKWRFIIPVRANVPGCRYTHIQAALFDMMADRGIECDRALTRPGQPIYLPNVPMDKRNAAAIPYFYEYEVHKGPSAFVWETSDVADREYQNTLADQQREQAALEAAKKRAEERKDPFGNQDTESVVDAFNDRHTVAELLERYQYARLGQSDQYQSRYQSSGSFATKDFGEYWVSLSASDANNGLGRGKDGYCAGDAFDLFAHYEHNGDFVDAVRKYGEEINPARPTAAQVLKPIMGSWEGEPLNETSPSGSGGNAPGEASGMTVVNGSGNQFKLHRIFTLADAEPVLKSSYLIKGWLGRSQMSVIYGPSNVGKSFFCLDMAFAVAANQEWNGCRVRGGPVLYLATEGGQAFKNRVYALRKNKGVSDAPLYVRPSPIDLLRAEVDLPALSELIKEITAKSGEIAMIVVDTLSRAMAGGNENGPEDMTRFIGNLDVLRDLTGAHIMVVHHSGKDTAAGARGHSSLRAASDSEIELELADGGLKLVKTTKQRDMEPKPPLGFTLGVLELGEDEDGDPVTTAFIEIADQADVDDLKRSRPGGGNQIAVIEAFKQLRSDGVGMANPGGTGWPAPGAFWAIPEADLKKHAKGKLSDKSNPDSAYSLAVKSMVKSGYMARNEGFLWIVAKEGMVG